ncbi:MAG: universal stress protein [Anaerolineales bacterium]|nr:universal stress protein [Anaerolineales bacterium]
MYKRILVPLDGTSSAEKILPHAKGLASDMGSELILLYVIPTAVAEFAPPARPFAKDLVYKEKRKLVRYLKDLCAKLEKENIRVNYLLSEGGIAETILEVADLMETDVIAMATNKHSPTQLLLLGSVAYDVVRRSPLPVLVIRA